MVDVIKNAEQSFNNFIEEMEYEMWKNDVARTLFSTSWKIVNNSATEEDLSELRLMLEYPVLVGVNFRNRTDNSINRFYDELLDIGKDILSEVDKITKD